MCKPTFYSGSLASAAPWVSKSTHPRKFDNHVTVHLPPADRPSTPQAYQCKITQSTGVATQMQREVVFAGNRIATRITPERVNKDENGKRELFLYPCYLKY